MGIDVCVHGIYGIEVPEEWESRLCRLLQSASETIHRKNNPDDWADFEPEDWRELAREGVLDMAVRQENHTEFADIVAALGAPPDVTLSYSGSDDDRLGHDEVDAGKLLIGYGLFTFPRQIPSGDWKWSPTWHVWAEGY